MKSIGMALAAFGALWTVSMGAAAAQEVRVTLNGVQARDGMIYASLQSEADFMQPRAAYGTAVAVTPGAVTIVFPDVAPGDYAFSAMHDENGDQQMASHPDGMPAEGYAMSNGAMMMGAPAFAINKFTVGAAPVHLTETMVYPPRLRAAQ